MKVTKKRLGRAFFTNTDVVGVAKALLGKIICAKINGVYCEAMITETEAYAGINDKACHAHMGRYTKRTATMYEKGGTAYIYLCYGIHHLFNIVTNIEGKADAVLIRSIEPIYGTKFMLNRRNVKTLKPSVFSGPGKLTKAMSIDKSYNATDLVNSKEIYIVDGNIKIEDIVKTTRIGINYAEEDALLPWRFYISGNKFISQP
jgi:DNA-3-methyladenine glycosylase